MNRDLQEIRWAFVDIGNSAIKLAFCDSLDNSTFPQVTRIDPRLHAWLDEIQQTIETITAAEIRWIVCSVNHHIKEQLKQSIQQNRPKDHWLELTHFDANFEIIPRPLEKIGTDRLMAVAGAIARLEATDLRIVIIDAGTAVTVDAVERINHTEHQFRFLGGTIRPGIELQRNALNRYTSALPDLSVTDSDIPSQVIGRSTEHAILSGTAYGELGAIMSLVELLEIEMGGPARVFHTGGDAVWMKSFFPSDWQYEPDLVLQGIRAVARQKLSS